MATYEECKFYLKGGKCSHRDAPKPRHSYCLGKDSCACWNDAVSHEVKE